MARPSANLDERTSSACATKRRGDRCGLTTPFRSTYRACHPNRGLGSRQQSSIDAGHCPVCHQAIEDSLLPLSGEHGMMSLDENIGFLEEQRATFVLVRQNAARIAEARLSQARATNTRLSESRQRVRDLRQVLISDARTPSVASIRRRVELESQIAKEVQAAEHFGRHLGELQSLSVDLARVGKALRELPKEDTTEEDRSKINAWTRSMKAQLEQYGFRSFPVAQVIISDGSYCPEHQGFDIEALPRDEEVTQAPGAIAMQTTISASDLIRTIWTYLHGMLEVARASNTNHPGCIVFDEPRQQSAKDVSFAALLRRASTSADAGQQVILFTSEDPNRLRASLAGLRHSLERIEGRALKKVV